jgi:hypothetical protein
MTKVAGVLVSLCSVGAGALGVAVLSFLYPRLPPVRIVGSDLGEQDAIGNAGRHAATD